MREQRWVVVELEFSTSSTYRWAVRDLAGVLGDLWQRHRGQADRIARLRNERMPWPEASPTPERRPEER